LPATQGIDGDGSVTIDAGPVVDADPSCAAAVVPFVPSNFVRCDVPAPVGEIEILAGQVGEIDTDSGVLDVDGTAVPIATAVVMQSDGSELLIVGTDSLLVAPGADLRFTGSRPIAIVSLTEIGIEGNVNIGGFGASDGPGANPAGCGVGANGEPQMDPGTSQIAASGGGGGGFGGAGGDGAQVTNGGPSSPGGDPNGNAEIVPLRGGCRGGDGGNANSGAGGGGGGALQLVAAQVIRVESGGTLTSPGGGGGDTLVTFSAGGGGGSGGALLLEAPEIRIDGSVTANGGGGGEGTRGGTNAEPGEDGHIDDADPALGGSGNNFGGDGGNGGSDGNAATDGLEGTNDSRSAGSGGGGGSVGRIRLNVDADPIVNGVVSPAPG
jgi:hypothetical protein